jgi:MFS family permease
VRNRLKAPALRYRDFRFLWLATFFNATAMMGERVVMGWLVLDLTDSPLMVGVAMGLSQAPFFFLGIMGGAVADKVDRRHLIRLLNAGMAVTGAGLGLLVLFDVIEVWHIFLLALATGSLRALNQTARQSFAYDVVGRENVVNGLAYIGLGMRIGGLIGALLVGLIYERAGAAFAYMMVAGGSAMAAVVLFPIRSRGQAAPPLGHSVWENVKGYFREARHNPSLLMLMCITAFIEMLGFSHQVLLPSLARDVLNAGPQGLGLMTGLSSVGGILGLVIISLLGEVRRKGLLLLGVIHVFGASIALLAMAGNLVTALVILVVTNAMMALADTLSQSLMQLVVPNELRGRAMGSWVLAIGMGPVGHLGLGGLASALGVAFALSFSGLGLVGIGVLSVILLPRVRRL